MKFAQALIVFFFLIGAVGGYSQQAGCPLKDGEFKDLKAQRYFTNCFPNDWTIITSTKSDTVRYFGKGEVFCIFNSRDDRVVVMIKISNDRFVVFRDLKKPTVTEGQILEEGDMVGLAAKEGAIFTSRISIFENRIAVNARNHIACRDLSSP